MKTSKATTSTTVGKSKKLQFEAQVAHPCLFDHLFTSDHDMRYVIMLIMSNVNNQPLAPDMNVNRLWLPLAKLE